MTLNPPTKVQRIINYLDIIVQTLLIGLAIILLVSPPQAEIAKELNNPPVRNLSDLITEIMARGTLNFFSIVMSLTLSIILMVLPLLLLWIYQIITAIGLSLIFKNRFNLVYGVVFLVITIVLSNLTLSNEAFERFAPVTLFVFFVFPFLFYGKRVYDIFIAK